jgi:Na+/H+-translocating membrane pyrophosphatase
MDEVQAFSGKEFKVVDITAPEVFVAGLAGGALVFVFSGYAVSAVGQAAGDVVVEVRRQFAEIEGIMDGTGRPDYGACVDIVAKAGLTLMIKPGLLAVGMPMACGLVFRVLGDYRGDSLLGAKALVGFLVFTSTTGMLMGLFLSNAGGAWDNGKKGIEAGALGGKGSKSHQAAVTGDTVGDPLKDCAGPSLHVVIKLVSTIALVMAPLFCG